MNSYMAFFDKIFGFFKNIGTSFYDSVIYDNRYEYIFEGLFNTILIAFFCRYYWYYSRCCYCSC